MAFSDLCHISNAYKTIENEVDQSDRIMEENSMVRDLITKILEETGPTEPISSVPPPDKSINTSITSQYPKNDAGFSFLQPAPPYSFNNNPYNYNQSDYLNMHNGINPNAFVIFPDTDINPLLTIDPIPDETVTPEQLNLLRLAAQEIGGAQFTSPNDEKYYNFFEPNQRNSFPDVNMFTTSYGRPNSLNIDTNYNSCFDAPYSQRYPNKYENDQSYLKEPSQDPVDLLAYLNQMTLSSDRVRDEPLLPSDFKMPMEMNSPYQNDEYNKLQEEKNRLFYNTRNYQVPTKFNGESIYPIDLMSQMPDRNLSYDFSNPVTSTSMNLRPNGYHQPNDFVPRRDMNPLLPRDGYQTSGNVDRTNYDTIARENAQQNLLRQQELARQMALFMRNRPPPNQLNVDVSLLHENTPFNLGLSALIGPNPPHGTMQAPPMLPSPLLDLPLLAPFYTMRNVKGAATASGILHARLDSCYEQWKQLERERKRTEARLALAYPGRAVSSSNSIPVPRLPPCPTRVDRLTVDMLREHTKVLTLMGKMETLRASVCVAQNKRPNKPEDGKITVLKRGQDTKPVVKEIDPATFDPSTWREDVKNLSDIAPHAEVESAMLSWRNAVAAVQAARRRELSPQARLVRPDPILQLADAVKQLSASARRARAAMWCDLTLTVALAPRACPGNGHTSPLLARASTSPKQAPQDIGTNSMNNSRPVEKKEEKASTDQQPKTEVKQDAEQKPNKQTDKEKNNQRRTPNYRKINQRNDYYHRNSRYDNRFVHNRHPYHYLATGPIN